MRSEPDIAAIAARTASSSSVLAFAAFFVVVLLAMAPLPADCTDGHAGAFWNRPERYLDPAVQRSISLMTRTPAPVLYQAMARLRDDLADMG